MCELINPSKNDSLRVVIALTGASGQIYGVEILKLLKTMNVETHLIISDSAKINLKLEGFDIEYVKNLAYRVYSNSEISSQLSSGSFFHDGMIIAPCSIKTASSIAYGITSNLITRAADVTLKERRKLILVVRETPLHTGHLRTLLNLSEIGAIIMPPVPAFYTKPQSVKDIVEQTAVRVLNLLGFQIDKWAWEGEI